MPPPLMSFHLHVTIIAHYNISTLFLIADMQVSFFNQFTLTFTRWSSKSWNISIRSRCSGSERDITRKEMSGDTYTTGDGVTNLHCPGLCPEGKCGCIDNHHFSSQILSLEENITMNDNVGFGFSSETSIETPKAIASLNRPWICEATFSPTGAKDVSVMGSAVW